MRKKKKEATTSLLTALLSVCVPANRYGKVLGSTLFQKQYSEIWFEIYTSDWGHCGRLISTSFMT